MTKDNYGPKYADENSQPKLKVEKSDGLTKKSDKEKTEEKNSDWLNSAIRQYQKGDADKGIERPKAPKNPYDTLVSTIPGKLHVINEIGKKSAKEDGPRHMPNAEEKKTEFSDIDTAESKATQIDSITKAGEPHSKASVNKSFKSPKGISDTSKVLHGSQIRALTKDLTRLNAKHGRHPAFQSASGFMGQGIDLADMFPKPVKPTQTDKTWQSGKNASGHPKTGQLTPPKTEGVSKTTFEAVKKQN